MSPDKKDQTKQNKLEKKSSDEQEKKPPFNADKFLRNLTEGEHLPLEEDYNDSSDSAQE